MGTSGWPWMLAAALVLLSAAMSGPAVGQEMVADFVLDQQLQMGILMALKKLGVEPRSIEEYRLFADKEFPEVPEEMRVAAEVRPSQR